MGKRAVLADVFVPVHVFPRALAPTLARAAAFSSRSRPGHDYDDYDDYDCCCAFDDGGVDDPRRV